MVRFLSAATALLLTASVLFALYAGSYVFLVKSIASPIDPLMKPRVARYPVGGVWAETFFWPVELVDRQVRHDYWTTPDCLHDMP